MIGYFWFIPRNFNKIKLAFEHDFESQAITSFLIARTVQYFVGDQFYYWRCDNEINNKTLDITSCLRCPSILPNKKFDFCQTILSQKHPIPTHLSNQSNQASSSFLSLTMYASIWSCFSSIHRLLFESLQSHNISVESSSIVEIGVEFDWFKWNCYFLWFQTNVQFFINFYLFGYLLGYWTEVSEALRWLRWIFICV